MKKLLLSAVTAAVVASIAPAMAQTAGTAPGTQGQKAKSPKSLNRAEVTPHVQQHFARLDSNRDGIVTKPEAEAAATAMSNRLQQRMTKRGTTMFDRLDTNKDGVVTGEEAEAVFATRQVDIAHAGRGDARQRRNWDALISRFDTNKDGAISRAEFDAGYANVARSIGSRARKGGLRHGGLHGRLFEMADLNNDGNVTLQEATRAALARFDAADVNRDGTLSPEEMRAAHQTLRGSAPRR